MMEYHPTSNQRSSVDKENNTPLVNSGGGSIDNDNVVKATVTKAASSLSPPLSNGQKEDNNGLSSIKSPSPHFHNDQTPLSTRLSSPASSSFYSSDDEESLSINSPSIINLLSPNSLLMITPPPLSTTTTATNNNTAANNNDSRTPNNNANNNANNNTRSSLTPPLPPSSQKLRITIKSIQYTLDNAIEDVKREINMQDVSEAMLRKELTIGGGVGDELEDEEEGGGKELEGQLVVVRGESSVGDVGNNRVIRSGLGVLEESVDTSEDEEDDDDVGQDDERAEDGSTDKNGKEHDDEVKREVSNSYNDDEIIVSSLQTMDLSSCNTSDDDDDEEEIIISRRPVATAAASSLHRRRIFDDDDDSSSSDSDGTLSETNNNEVDTSDNNVELEQEDFVMIDEDTVEFETEEKVVKSNEEEESILDLDDGFADLKITNDVIEQEEDGDDDISDVSFGQNNRYVDHSFNVDEHELEEGNDDYGEEEGINDEDSLQSATRTSPKKDDNNDDEDSILCFEGCGCWSLNNDTGDLYLSSSVDNDDNAESNEKKKKNKAKWPKIRLPLALYNKLYQHQRIGCQWMASLHHNDIKGGILADDMGLGKTMQTLAYLGSLMRAETISNAVIICPKSVVRSWEREANLILKNMCVPKATVSAVTSDMGKEKRKRVFEDAFTCTAKRPHLVITTYGLVSNHITDLTYLSNTFEDYRWNYIVLDEGHQIKNSSTKMSKDVRILASRSPLTRRLLLTGTPIQNSMKELHTLFDWACGGKLLGSLKTFLNKYGIPIEEGRQKNASQWTVKKAAEMNGKLQTLLKPYFLQRLKKTEFQDKLPGKKELVVFTHLSAKQRLLYESYLDGDIVSSVLTGETASPLAAVSWLKMLCGHPSLVKEAADDYKDCDVDLLVRDSAKLQVLISLVLRLKRSNHKCLIFSMSTKMLDIISYALDGCVRHLRIDGSTANNYRQKAVDHFNDEESNIDVMLLSTKAAGVGLTLTGADRAIIYDPSWNPAEDAQAVDRCYRIGQKKPVTVYRFISAGTVEEKIYEKQVHKDGIRRVILAGGSSNSTERYFEKDELRELFKLGSRGESSMMGKFNSKTDNDATGASGKKSFLTKHTSVVGVASHDVLYSTGTLDKDPFSREPYQLKKAKGRRSTSSDDENGTNKDDSDSIEDLTIPYSPRADAVPLGNKLNKAKVTKTKISNEPTPRTESGGTTEEVVATLDEADSLIADQEYDKAMSLLLDMVENENIVLAQNHKLDTHRKIAQIGKILGWLG